MKTLRDIMRPGFIFGVQRDASVADAARTMTTNNVGIVAVFAGDRLVGVFSERDIVRRVVDRGLDPIATPVADVMTTDLVVAQADDDYQSAMRQGDQLVYETGFPDVLGDCFLCVSPVIILHHNVVSGQSSVFTTNMVCSP